MSVYLSVCQPIVVVVVVVVARWEIPGFDCCSLGTLLGEFHVQGEAKWILIRGQLRGHYDTTFGRPTPGRPIDRPGVGCPQGIFGVLVTIN
jgi:hypothetical protein